MNTALDAASMLFNMLPPGSLLFKTTTPAPAIQLNELDKFTLHQENGNFLNVLLCPYCLKT